MVNNLLCSSHVSGKVAEPNIKLVSFLLRDQVVPIPYCLKFFIIIMVNELRYGFSLTKHILTPTFSDFMSY